METAPDLEAFGRREAEILESLAKRREETISALVRELVLQTIDEVEKLVEKGSESDASSSR